uniref:Uncharacterized protein n=1 Tax=Timema tahoe TaxID=61484 RepID=A0A7R9P292_9NEOP|nr:unnamed protein product [Timema tahoe]
MSTRLRVSWGTATPGAPVSWTTARWTPQTSVFAAGSVSRQGC